MQDRDSKFFLPEYPSVVDCLRRHFQWNRTIADCMGPQATVFEQIPIRTQFMGAGAGGSAISGGAQRGHTRPAFG